jgi:choice-of-anchor A domain-containing protein
MKNTRILSTVFTMSFLLGGSAFAGECRAIQPTDYLVFSAQDIQYSESDFQGLTGAGRDAVFANFLLTQSDPTLCDVLVAGRNVTFNDGNIDGGGVAVGAGFDLEHGTVSGQVHYGSDREALQSLDAAATFFREKSEELSGLKTNCKPQLTDAGMTLHASAPVTVFSLSADEFAQSGVVTVEGTSSSIVVVNLHGKQATVQGVDIELKGLRPEQVILNFPEALSLTITASGSQALGVPTVLAPSADTTFYNDHITGGLYVGNLHGDGQVNSAKTRWPE